MLAQKIIYNIVSNYKIFLYHTIWEIAYKILNSFCRLFAFKFKLKPGTALKVSSRRFCRVNGNVFTD